MSLETEMSCLREVVLALKGAINTLTTELQATRLDLQALQNEKEGLKSKINDLEPSPQTDWVAEPPPPPAPIKKKRGRPAKKAEAPEPQVPPAPEVSLPTIPIPVAQPVEMGLQYSQISAAVVELCKTASKQHAVDLLASFGVKNARELPEEVWPQFLAQASIVAQSAAG